MTARFLLDTMVVSENFKKRPSEAAVRWTANILPDALAVSAITFGEIQAGIEKQRLRNVLMFERLEAWLLDTRFAYADRTLSVTTDIALRWGRMMTALQRRDVDLLIAATALEHDLTVVTRNIRHFEPTGVRLLNPYEA